MARAQGAPHCGVTVRYSLQRGDGSTRQLFIHGTHLNMAHDLNQNDISRSDVTPTPRIAIG
jgi:hypothetical protein